MIEGLLRGIARQEGFYAQGNTRAKRNNNPGNITWGAWARAHGATGAEQPLGRYAVFPTPLAGFQAMRALLQLPAYQTLTLAQVLERWAPPTENDSAAYIAHVCEWTGAHPDTPLTAMDLSLPPGISDVASHSKEG